MAIRGLLTAASLLGIGALAARPGRDAVAVANATGDLLLGGLFPIHRKGAAGESCGEIQLEDGIQPLEAMLYTVERLNRDPTILPGVRLGVLAFDTCDNPGYALARAFSFVKGYLARGDRYGEEGYRCEDRSAPSFADGQFDRVIAVLGAQSSSVTIQVASVLALFPIPQISYMATSPVLASRERFPRFFRTVPSDVNQARAMLEILRRLEWRYASAVYTDTEYGDRGFETLASLAAEYSVCFGAAQRISVDRFAAADYERAIRAIAEKTETRGKARWREGVERRLSGGGAFSGGAVRGEGDDGAGAGGGPAARPRLPVRLAGQRLVAERAGAERARGRDRGAAALRPARRLRPVLCGAQAGAARANESLVPGVLAGVPRLRGGRRAAAALLLRSGAEDRPEHRLPAAPLPALCPGRGARGGLRPRGHAAGGVRRRELGPVRRDAAVPRGRVRPPPGEGVVPGRDGQGVPVRERGRRAAEVLDPELPADRERIAPLARGRHLRAGRAGPAGAPAGARRAAPPRGSGVDVLPAVRAESDRGSEEGGPVLLAVPELRPLPVQGGRGAVRGVRAGQPARRERLGLRADPGAIRRLLASLGDRRDGGGGARRRPDRVRRLGVLAVPRHPDDQGVRPRAVLPAAARHPRLLLDDVRRGGPAERAQLRDRPGRARLLLRRLLRRARHQDQPDPPDLQPGGPGRPRAAVHRPRRAARDSDGPRAARGRARRGVAGPGPARGGALVPDQGRERPRLPGLRGRLGRARPRLPVPSHRGGHLLRDQDEKVPGGVQREPADRVRHLRDDRAVAGLRPPLPRLDEQRGPGDHPGALAVPERPGPAALPLSAEGVRGAGQAGEEHEGAGDGAPRRPLLRRGPAVLVDRLPVRHLGQGRGGGEEKRRGVGGVARVLSPRCSRKEERMKKIKNAFAARLEDVDRRGRRSRPGFAPKAFRGRNG